MCSGKGDWTRPVFSGVNCSELAGRVRFLELSATASGTRGVVARDELDDASEQAGRCSGTWRLT